MNLGGPALIAAEIAKGLDPDRFEHRLVAGVVGKDEGDYVKERDPVAVTELSALGREVSPIDDLQALRQLRRCVREFRPHIVHTHTSKAGTLGRLAAWTSRVPATVHTFHGHHLHGYFSPAKSKAIVLNERLFATRTTRLTAVGNNVRDELLDAGVGRRDQYTVIEPGVELPTPPSQASAREGLGLPQGADVLVYVARLTGIKRPDRMLAVFSAVAQERPEAILIVAGEGDQSAAIRAQARAAPWGGQVRFLGWRHDVETLYSAGDIVVLTSDNEGMPVSLIEAALCGLPAVAPAVGSVAEVVIHGKTGFVTAPSTAELSRAIVELLADPARRRQMGVAAREHAQSKFTPAQLVPKVAAVYEDIQREKRVSAR